MWEPGDGRVFLVVFVMWKGVRLVLASEIRLLGLDSCHQTYRNDPYNKSMPSKVLRQNNLI